MLIRRVCSGLVAACALLAALLAHVAPASAQGTPEERRACGPDAMRLCREFVPNFAAVDACLNRRQAELSEACRAIVVSPATEPTRTSQRQATPQRKVKAKEKSKKVERVGKPGKARLIAHEKTHGKKAKHADRAKHDHGHRAGHERARTMKHAHDKASHGPKRQSSRTGKKSRTQ